MYPRNRRRRSLYGYERESRMPQALRSVITLVVLATAVWWIGGLFISFFLGGSAVEREASTLYTEGRGLISVSLQGEDEQAAENGMNMFPGDVISTGPTASTSLRVFDGTWARIGSGTELSLDESARGRGDVRSEVALTLKVGSLWIATPPANVFTGSVLRRIDTPLFALELPPHTEAFVSGGTIIVYSADGEGVVVRAKGIKDFTVGEGQKWARPEGRVTDPYIWRSPLAPEDQKIAFVMDSRTRVRAAAPVATGSGSVVTETLTLSEPAVGFTLRDATLTVSGTAGKGVAKVQVNGGEAILDVAKRTFTQQVTPPEGAASFDITVKALGTDGKTLNAVTRTVAVERTIVSPDAPTITSPAATGQTFRTDASEIVLRGLAPAGTSVIYVNDYKLQLFTPEKGTWSYLASQSLGNLKEGTNVYSVTAADASGTRGSAAAITVIVGEGEGGVSGATTSVAGTTQTPAASSKPAVLDPSTLPRNAPLSPGTLTVTGPTPGGSHAETGTGFLLEGKTSVQTASVWVNDYKLQLYTPGKTFWNYIATVQNGNLKRGKNTYRIVARDAQSNILDAFEYEVTFTPGRED